MKQQLIERLVNLLDLSADQNPHILDIGCGSGDLLGAIQAQGVIVKSGVCP